MNSFLPDILSRSGKIKRLAKAICLCVALVEAVSVVRAEESTGEKMLNVFTRDEGGQIHFYAQNLTLGNVTATVSTKTVNMAPSVPLPCTALVP